MCDNMSERPEPQLTLETVGVFSIDRVAMRQPAVKFAAPESVVADFSVRQPVPAPRQVPTSRDHR